VARIVVVHPGDDSYGIDRVAVVTARALTQAGHEVSFLLDSSNPGSSWLSRRLGADGIPWRALDLAHLSRGRFDGPRALAGWIRSWSTCVPAVWRATATADLVYINGLTMVPAAITSRLRRRRVVWHLHEIPPAGRLLGRIVRVFSHRQLCVSRAVATSFGLPGRTSRVLYNGVDLAGDVVAQHDGTAEDPVRIGIVARINAWKGHDVLAAAFVLLMERGVDCRLVVIGAAHPHDQEMERTLERVLAPYLPTGAAVLAGQSDDGAAAMLDLEILAAPSTRPDPFPVTVLEAMSRGLPIVATGIGGHPEAIVDESTGLLVAPGDPVALADALARLVASRELRARMGKAAHERCARRFSIAGFQAGLIEAIDEALA
jgi:glycosyltransferase involved in cell wall biosynthesis